MDRINKDQYYLGIAESVAQRSTCLRRRYGAIIVNHDEVISTGYNGAPRGEVNCCDCGFCQREAMGVPKGERYELCVSVHAEQNAIISAARKDMIGATIYIVGLEKDGSYANPAPCLMCRRFIRNAGIVKCVGNVNGVPTEISLDMPKAEVPEVKPVCNQKAQSEKAHQVHISLVRQPEGEDELRIDDLFLIVSGDVYNSAGKLAWSEPRFVESFLRRMAENWLTTKKGWMSNCEVCREYNWNDFLMDLPVSEYGGVLNLAREESIPVEKYTVDIMVDQYEFLAPRSVPAEVFIPGENISCGTATVDFQKGWVSKLELYKNSVLDDVEKLHLRIAGDEFTAFRGPHEKQWWYLEK